MCSQSGKGYTGGMKWVAVLASIFLTAPLVAFASFDVDIEYGMRGSAVVELQQFLASKGFFRSEDATGNFYSLTLDAVRHYQAAHGIPATGYVGPLTRAQMNAASTPAMGAPALSLESSITVPTTGEYTKIRDLQQKLAALLQQIQALKGGAVQVPFAAPDPAALEPFDFDPAWRDAVVNILCTSRYGGINDILSGSGIIVDPRGVILTNAHVAHAFVFSQWPDPSLYQCSIRVGSPASPRYKAALLYIPDVWMQENIEGSFKAEDKTVYGEHDYALLLITGPTSDTVQMPASFPSLPLHLAGALPPKSPVYLSGYPAENLGGEAVQRGLYQVSSPSMVGEMRTIPGHSTPDLITFDGNIAAQHGSSGGAVLTRGGALAGLITFLDKDYGRTTAERVLNAITTEYISRDMQEGLGVTLAKFLATQDLDGTSHNFMSVRGKIYQDAYAALWKSKGFAIPGL